MIHSFSSDIFQFNTTPEYINIDFLLPNGLIISLDFNRETTLKEIRRHLYKVIETELDLHISPTDSYTFTSINEEAEFVEFYDYKKKFSELKLFGDVAFFKLIKNEGDVSEKLSNLELSNVCGLNIEEIDSLKEEELIEYRLELFKIVRQRLLKEEKLNSIKNNLAAFEAKFAPDLEIDSDQLKIDNNNTNQKQWHNVSHIEIKIIEVDRKLNMEAMDFEVPLVWTPSKVIEDYINKIHPTKTRYLNELVEGYKRHNLVLNIIGSEEIMFGNQHKLAAYKYIRKCLSTNTQPRFFINTKDKLRSNLQATNTQLLLPKIEAIIASLEETIKVNQDRNKNKVSWKLLSLDSNEYFSFYLRYLSYYPISKENERIFIRAAIYHGSDMVGQEIDSNMIESNKIEENHFLDFNCTMNFNVKLNELHRSAKLCICLNSIAKRRKDVSPIAWISLNIFDYKSSIINGMKNIYLWPPQPQKSFTNMCISEVTGQNPNKSFALLKAEFLVDKSHVYYPTAMEITKIYNRYSRNSQDDCLDMNLMADSGDMYSLENILGKDSLAELTEQDKNFLWTHRYDCIKFPNSLPKLLQTVNWGHRKSVAEMYSLLREWPDLKPNIAIELLNSNFFDIEVRSFAVRCLNKYMKNEDIRTYLLQLVQAIKNESYYDNDLSKFLLKRALETQRLGFDLYWNLKSEMKNLRYKYKFGLMLEAYCRAIGVQLKNLVKQTEVIDNLSTISTFVKKNKENLTLITGSYLRDELETPQNRKIFSNFLNPTNKSYILGAINPYECKILSSAKRPLYLKWMNTTNFAELFEDSNFDLIFKNGDDLRQDMLTIQILKLMNTIWNNEGLNLNMLLYDCVSTGYNIGFIEVIKHSVTIFKIQSQGGTRSQFQVDKDQLYKWIQANNPTKHLLDKAIDNFTKSCAGFCVATFILGIGDRHPDNIMINKQGKLFHIDFGHFLGHFKTKYGFKRERVPFVLPKVFTKVISRGAANPQSTKEFKRFQTLCEDAFMVIRKYSHFLLNLLTLMISSGMPELQSNDDVMYMRNQLAVDETDEKARKFFSEQFDNVLKLAYTTQIDWVFHAMNKNNRL